MPTLDPTRWVDLYANDLFRMAMYRLNDVALSEDVVQDTFLAALKAKKDFNGDSSEKTWLTAILKNKIADVFRSKQRAFKETDIKWENYMFEQEPYDTHWKKNEAPADWSLNGEEKIISSAYRQVLKQCMSRLSGQQQSLLQYKFFQGKKGEVICKEMNLSPSNFWVMMHRINLQLRKCLEQNWFILK